MSLEKYRRFRWSQNQLISKPSLEITYGIFVLLGTRHIIPYKLYDKNKIPNTQHEQFKKKL